MCCKDNVPSRDSMRNLVTQLEASHILYGRKTVQCIRELQKGTKPEELLKKFTRSNVEIAQRLVDAINNKLATLVVHTPGPSIRMELMPDGSKRKTVDPGLGFMEVVDGRPQVAFFVRNLGQRAQSVEFRQRLAGGVQNFGRSGHFFPQFEE